MVFVGLTLIVQAHFDLSGLEKSRSFKAFRYVFNLPYEISISKPWKNMKSALKRPWFRKPKVDPIKDFENKIKSGGYVDENGKVQPPNVKEKRPSMVEDTDIILER